MNYLNYKLTVLVFLLLLVLGLPLSAQAGIDNDDGNNDGNGNGEELPEDAPEPSMPETEEPPEEEEQFIEPYELGSQHFTINGGFFRPLFFHFPGNNDDTDTFESSFGQLSLGGSGSLAWGSYVNNRFSLGVELAGTFSFDPNGATHSLIPITMSVEYMFRNAGFEFPVSLHGGVVFNRYKDQLYFGPVVKPGISGYYNLNAEWGLGLSLNYWWVPEIYFGEHGDNSSFGNMLDLSFSARYHFS